MLAKKGEDGAKSEGEALLREIVVLETQLLELREMLEATIANTKTQVTCTPYRRTLTPGDTLTPYSGWHPIGLGIRIWSTLRLRFRLIPSPFFSSETVKGSWVRAAGQGQVSHHPFT